MLKTRKLGGGWITQLRDRILTSTQTFQEGYELVLANGGYPRRIAVSITLTRDDLLELAGWYALGYPHPIQASRCYQLLNAAIEMGHDPAIPCLTEDATRRIGRLAGDVLQGPEFLAEQERERALPGNIVWDPERQERRKE